MSNIFSFTISPGFATSEMINSITNDIISNFPDNSLLSINVIDDVINVVFQNIISDSNDLNTLHQIIASKDIITSKNIVQKYNPETQSLSNTNYTKIGRFYFKGTNVTGEIRGIDIISNIDSGATSYSVQLLIRSTNTLLANVTFNNTDVEINTADILQDFPYDSCVIDVLAKINRPALKVLYAHIDEITLWN